MAIDSQMVSPSMVRQGRWPQGYEGFIASQPSRSSHGGGILSSVYLDKHLMHEKYQLI